MVVVVVLAIICGCGHVFGYGLCCDWSSWLNILQNFTSCFCEAAAGSTRILYKYDIMIYIMIFGWYIFHIIMMTHIYDTFQATNLQHCGHLLTHQGNGLENRSERELRIKNNFEHELLIKYIAVPISLCWNDNQHKEPMNRCNDHLDGLLTAANLTS